MIRLADFIDQRLVPSVDEIDLGDEQIQSILRDVFGDQLAESQATQIGQMIRRQLGETDDTLAARSGGWVIHATRGAIQASILGGVIATALKSVTNTDLWVAVLPAIIPFLFQIEKTQLSMKNEEILLTLYQAAETHGKTADEIYSLLPAAIRSELNRLDLLEFLDALKHSGHAKEVAHGIFQLRHPDKPRLAIKIV